MKTYSGWANEIVKKVGTVGANKLILELQKEVNRIEADYSSSNNSSLGTQISAVESGNITHR